MPDDAVQSRASVTQNATPNGFGYAGYGQTVMALPIWWLAMNCGDFYAEYDKFSPSKESFFVARAYYADGKPESDQKGLEDSVLYQNVNGNNFIGPSVEYDSPLYAVGIRKHGGEYDEEDEEEPLSETFTTAQFKGIYNGYPVYRFGGASDLGDLYMFRSVFRDDKLVVSNNSEPAAMRIVEYSDRGDGTDSGNVAYSERWDGDGWWESTSSRIGCLGSPVKFKAAGAYLGEDEFKNVSYDVTVYMIRFTKNNSSGGVPGDYSKNSVAGYGRLSSIDSSLAGGLHLGTMQWLYRVDGKVKGIYSMDPGNCHTAGPHRTEVYTTSGGVIPCPNGLWLFARNEHGGWVVNIDGHAVRSGENLVAHFKWNRDLNSLFRNVEGFEPGVEVKPKGVSYDDIVLEWYDVGYGSMKMHKRLNTSQVAMVDAASL